MIFSHHHAHARRDVDMTQGSITRHLIQFALPLLAGNVFQQLYNMVDTWVVGNFVSNEAFSAVGTVGPIINMLIGFFMGLSSGAGVVISQYYGAHRPEKVRDTVHTAMVLTLVLCAAFTALGLALIPAMLDLMNTPAEVLPESTAYLSIYFSGITGLLIYNMGSGILRAVGDSRRPFYFLVVSAVLNTGLDLLFVIRFHLGVAGVAWATIIAQAVGSFYALYCVYRRREDLGFDFRLSSFRIHGPTLKVILKLGTPLVIMSASITISMMVVNSFVNTFGVAASNVTGIGAKLNSLVSVVTSSMQTAVGSMVAQNFAAGRIDRVKKVNAVSNLVCILFFAVVGTVSFLFPEQIIGIFTQATDTGTLALATPYMRAAFWLYLAFCLMATSLGHINGVGFTTLNLVIAVLDGVIGRIGLSLLFGLALDWGVEGFWWGNSLAAFISVFMGLGYYFFGHWEKRELMLKDTE